jgi:hypothetical protein
MKTLAGSHAIGALRTRARVAAHVVWDHLADPPARTADEVPWRAEAITPDWSRRPWRRRPRARARSPWR